MKILFNILLLMKKILIKILEKIQFKSIYY